MYLVGSNFLAARNGTLALAPSAGTICYIYIVLWDSGPGTLCRYYSIYIYCTMGLWPLPLCVTLCVVPHDCVGRSTDHPGTGSTKVLVCCCGFFHLVETATGSMQSSIRCGGSYQREQPVSTSKSRFPVLITLCLLLLCLWVAVCC